MFTTACTLSFHWVEKNVQSLILFFFSAPRSLFPSIHICTSLNPVQCQSQWKKQQTKKRRTLFSWPRRPKRIDCVPLNLFLFVCFELQLLHVFLIQSKGEKDYILCGMLQGYLPWDIHWQRAYVREVVGGGGVINNPFLMCPYCVHIKPRWQSHFSYDL